MKYVMEHTAEFERLEQQARHSSYAFEKELGAIAIPPAAQVLDAGCGSGVVSRFVAGRFPRSVVLGCDFSAERVAAARLAGAHLGNLRFDHENLTRLSYPEATFDVAICRLVLEHLDAADRAAALREILRVLKPGGMLYAIDVDGAFHNIYPQTELVTHGLRLLAGSERVDLRIGRKIPSLLTGAGFQVVESRIDVVSFQARSSELAEEAAMIKARFAQAAAFFEEMLGGRAEAARFAEDYLETLGRDDVVLFYNMFVVAGRKPALARVLQHPRSGG